MINDIVTGASVEVCVARRLTPQTPDLEVRGSSLACDVVPLDEELYSTVFVSLHPGVYMGAGDNLLGGNPVTD